MRISLPSCEAHRSSNGTGFSSTSVSMFLPPVLHYCLFAASVLVLGSQIPGNKVALKARSKPDILCNTPHVQRKNVNYVNYFPINANINDFLGLQYVPTKAKLLSHLVHSLAKFQNILPTQTQCFEYYYRSLNLCQYHANMQILQRTKEQNGSLSTFYCSTLIKEI